MVRFFWKVRFIFPLQSIFTSAKAQEAIDTPWVQDSQGLSLGSAVLAMS